jgi:hypothetical protein
LLVVGDIDGNVLTEVASGATGCNRLLVVGDIDGNDLTEDSDTLKVLFCARKR